MSAIPILIVEDEAKMAEALKRGLQAEGYDATTATTGEEAIAVAAARPFEMILLDVLLPGRSGIDVLKAVRRSGSSVPVLVLTARDAVEHRVEGLDAGADDYLVKPFAFAELLARIRVLLRRGRTDQPARLAVGDLTLDPVARQAKRGGRVLALTAREFTLIEFLVRHQGQVVSRDMLARDVWNEPNRGTPLDNVIDVHIMRLRRKVDPEPEARLIHTVRGVGFVLREGEP